MHALSRDCARGSRISSPLCRAAAVARTLKGNKGYKLFGMMGRSLAMTTTLTGTPTGPLRDGPGGTPGDPSYMSTLVPKVHRNSSACGRAHGGQPRQERCILDVD